MAKKTSKSKKFSFINELTDKLGKVAIANKKGEVKVKRSELKKALEEVFTHGAIRAAGGERVRFPVIGTLVRREVKARKGGKGVNPFTGEPMMVKARPATKKPRWSFPKNLKETFANKKYW